MIVIHLDPEGAPHWLKNKGRDWIRWFIRTEKAKRRKTPRIARRKKDQS